MLVAIMVACTIVSTSSCTRGCLSWPLQAHTTATNGNGARLSLSDSNAYLKPLRQAHASLRAFGEGREHLHHGLLHVAAAPPFPRRLPLGRVALLAPCCREAEHSAQQREQPATSFFFWGIELDVGYSRSKHHIALSNLSTRTVFRRPGPSIQVKHIVRRLAIKIAEGD